jgi:hypothetical protein
MDAISIPKESIKTVWNLVENDITKALIRSGGYANSDYFKQQCLEGLFSVMDCLGFREQKQVLWSLCN